MTSDLHASVVRVYAPTDAGTAKFSSGVLLRHPANPQLVFVATNAHAISGSTDQIALAYYEQGELPLEFIPRDAFSLHYAAL
jgi:hypothetical protein